MADLNDLGVVAASERGADLTLKHPATGVDLDIVMTVLGFDAEVVVQAARAFDRAEAKRDASDRDTDDDGPTARRNRALAKAAVTGWKNVERDGKPVEFSAAEAAKVLDDANFVWIVHQVAAFGGKRGNFFPKASAD